MIFAGRQRWRSASCVRCKRRGTVCFPAISCRTRPTRLDVIEHLAAEYAQGELSLRQVAWGQLGDRTPAHTTLHGWTEGLGAHALGRPGRRRGRRTDRAAFVAEAESHVP